MKISLTHADIVTAVENHVTNLLHTTDATTIDIVVVSKDGEPLELEAVLNNVTLNTAPTIPTQTAPKKRRSSAEVAAERAAKQGRKALNAEQVPVLAPAPTPTETPAFDPASMLTTTNEAVEADVEPVEPQIKAEPSPVASEPVQAPVAQAEAPVNPFLANVQAQPQTQPSTAPAQASGAFLFPQTK